MVRTRKAERYAPPRPDAAADLFSYNVRVGKALEREAARLEDETRREQEELRRQEAQRLERKRAHAELVSQRERQRTQQPAHSTSGAKPRWGTPEARMDAMMELRRRIDKSREPGGKKNRD
jgi:cobalamin-dependent methionine synthase I